MNETSVNEEAIAPAPEAIPDHEFALQQRENMYVDDVEDNERKFESVTPFQAEVLRRLEAIESTQDNLKDGVNTIGGMMNSVAEAFDNIMQKVNEGGIGALLGGMMGGKKNG